MATAPAAGASSAEPRSAAGRERLVAILETAAAIARRALPFARGMTLVTTLSALWLAWTIQDLSGAAVGVTVAILLVLMIPAFVLGWLWWLLAELVELPENVGGVYDSLHGMTRSRRREASDAAPRPEGVGGLFRVGGLLREALGLAMDSESIYSAVLGVMVFANPLFLLVLGASLLWAFGQIGIAALAGLLALIL